ncbi:MAG: ATP-dependent DNA helicase [Oscillatoriales cyanobacterium RM2_1_1]|nr:ATP-dependent DNA helicase [Oscillatoriales cyanobacterium RM2_1_1]
MIEVEVHQYLQAILKAQDQVPWPHNLTMARLVARALRLGRNALIQTGISPRNLSHSYRLSYLVPVLTWPGTVMIVACEDILESLQEAIPGLYTRDQALTSITASTPLMAQFPAPKPIYRGDRWPDPDFQGLMLTSPESWLADRLQGSHGFPGNIPTLIDGIDDLELWAHRQLTIRIHPQDWNQLIQARPDQAEGIRNVQAQLTQVIFQHPPNPYNCHLLDIPEQEILHQLHEDLTGASRNGYQPQTTQSHQSIQGRSDPGATLAPWEKFWQQWQILDQLKWVELNRARGQFSLCCSPSEMTSALSHVWSQQPVVLIGGAVDLEKRAPIYRQNIGLEEVTCVKFAPDPQSQLIQLYLPSRLPLPNTPKFQAALTEELRTLLWVSHASQGLTVLLIDDVPLKAQIGASLAGEFGSRVQVETPEVQETGILVTGWEFWQAFQGKLPEPQILAIATLPLPSLEHPLVAGQVAYYKQQRQDWFRLYLLPTALNQLQRAVAPVRETQGVVALFDSRVLHRSYGQQVLAALNPFARINYLDTLWLNH